MNDNAWSAAGHPTETDVVPAVLALWRRLPVLARAVISGLVMAAAGTLPWAFLIAENIRHASAIPWAVPPAALYLWLYWRYARGAGWPRATSEARRTSARTRRLDGDVWGIAIMAGILGLWAVLLLQGVLSRLVVLPQQRDIDPSRYPAATVLAWVLMSAVVAGVAEETSFRGYMQRPIERRHGPVVAIVVTGVLFGFGHFTHPEVSLVLLPFYVTVAAVYGTLAWLTDSILPGVMLHAGGNVLGALQLFGSGRSEWQGAAPGTPLVWQTGADASFWLSVTAMLIVGALAVAAYAALARTVRTAAPGGS